MGSKRGRFLIRQPRIKKESELTDHSIHEVDEHHHHHHQHQIYTGLLSVPPPKIERHASEPSPSHSQKHNLLTVPSSFLVKQHSHPLLPSQSHSPPITTLTLQRQLSHPIPQTATTMTSATLTTQLSMDSNLQFVSSTIKTEDLMPISKASSPTVVIVTDPMSQIGELPTLRVKTDELHRSISTPQSLTRELSTESTRSSHCPLVRPGPALGCNFCWNTIDAHGRILRRKTKYHCPECQTNLCIVPCFQEFHERQSSDSSSTGTGGGGGVGSGGAAQNENNKQLSTPSLRHYPKTGSL